MALSLLAATCFTTNSCKEDIDESDLYTFTGEMMIDHFVNHPDTFSNYLTLLQQVHPSHRSSSTMYELLSARGHYTCFAPTNEAIQHYLDSLFEIQELDSKLVSELPDSVAESIVFNSLIDTGDQIEAYATTDFKKILPTPNMNGRIMSWDGTSIDGETGMPLDYINIYSRIIEKDIEVENGYIHVVDHVISPSNSTVGDLIGATENLTLFSSFLTLTGWDKKLTEFRDYVYENGDKAGTYYEGYKGGWRGKYPEHRDIMYTVFVETNDVLQRNNITDVETLKAWLKEHADYDNKTSWGDDYEDDNNAVNQFVAYHLLRVGLPANRLVTWSNERGYWNSNLNTEGKYKVDVWEYWETMGKHRRSIKITGTKKEGLRINRKSEHNQTNFNELTVDIPGIRIRETNGKYTNDALNGYYYPIEDVLVWNTDVPMKVLNERMRYDICSLLPELINAGCRLNRTESWYFTPDFFENIPYTNENTDFEYLSNTGGQGGSGGWLNYQSDEFNIRRIYDFTMKLPPVPYTDTYEIRYGVNANNNRGMAQIYLGTNPNNLPAYGIPLDLRIGGSSLGWKSDASLGASEAVEEYDRQLRNYGYMKGPKYFWPGENIEGRECTNCLRRIIFTGRLEAGVTYYIRFKSVLEDESSEFFYDYLEIVPKSVFNGIRAEDKW